MKKIFFLLLGLILSGNLHISTPAQTTVEKKMNVAILIFDGVQIIDYTGPYEVLGSRRRRNVYTVAEKANAITTNMGMRVIPNYTFANQPKPDIIILPGGGNISTGEGARGVGAQLNNQVVMEWVKTNAGDAKYVMSVCNGAFFLAKAGLLENLPATTTAGFIPRLTDFSPTIKPVYDKRFVDTGKIITTAGLTSGIDGAIHLVEKLDGKGWAKYIAMGIEYNWQPDSDYTRASLADTKFPDSLGNIITADSDPVDIKGGKDEFVEKWLVPANMSADEFLSVVDKEWAAGKGWSRKNGAKPGSGWELSDAGGKRWKGWATAEPAADKGKLLVTIGIALNAKRSE